TNAAFSCGAAAPLAGIAATFTKWFRKGADAAGDVAGAGRRSGGGPPGCSSFVPGTGVLLADGRVKPVEEVEVGDRVWATDPETGEEGPRTVVATITSSGIKELVEITVDIDGADGDKTTTVVATAEHPFWVDDQGRWLNANALTPGNDLRSADGDQFQVLSLESRTESRRVHNLTINGVHTYYAVASDVGVLAHNSSGPCDWKSEFRDLEKGNNQHVREVPTVQEMRESFEKWTAGAERMPARGSKIPDVFKLQDGTIMQWRTSSRSGGPTIDIIPPSGKSWKVHLSNE
ncbi:polymorphic toxin-type HINT domain-containing protein, partial [Saccharomonospora azurea]|uniref:polymorphic toxin-type HINT domain-containing protein n=2 Tax=Saccharomonospora azurea TaxID=40988 RepID=UPI001C3FB335